ncbi:MAG: isocitrate/isopropylmalate family dehydrogenase, partial [Alphaproteobacteria bacterium]|nr:isocitrate/isopropylmalate family dehydrogenase [Alphaproteobacteria bacterium]
MQVLILPGDGIGPEIANAARRGLEALDARFALGLQLSEGRVGLAALERDGTTWPDAAEAAVRAADLTILGPVDTAAYPSPEEGGVNPSAAVRTRLELYANMRPSRALKGVPALAPGMDLLVARENTEGFYADRNMFAGSGEFMATEDVGLAVRKITRRGSE